MDAFEEHQLFIPIINDARFAITLKRFCWNDLEDQFRKETKQAIRVTGLENNLSVTPANRENVTIALWQHYQREREEEADRQFQRSTPCEAHIPEPPRPSLKQEPTIMATKAPAFETRHFVDGVDASDLSDDALIEAIKRLEKELEAMSTVKTVSKKIQGKIDQLDSQRLAIAALLDSRA